MLLQMERAKPREFTMGRQRSIPSFEDQIAADKLRLEAEVAHLPSGRRNDRAAKENQATGDGISHKRLAFLAGPSTAQGFALKA